jgi:hypothetical protein
VDIEYLRKRNSSTADAAAYMMKMEQKILHYAGKKVVVRAAEHE